MWIRSPQRSEVHPLNEHFEVVHHLVCDLSLSVKVEYISI